MNASWDGGVSFHIYGSLTLTYDIVCRMVLSLVHIFYIRLGNNHKFGVWVHLWMVICIVPFLGHCDFDL